MKPMYKHLSNNVAFLTRAKNPTLSVIKRNETDEWLNHCYFKISSAKVFASKSIMDIYYFAVYNHHKKLGVFTYTQIINMLIDANYPLRLTAYPRFTTEQRSKYKYPKYTMYKLLDAWRKYVKLNEHNNQILMFKKMTPELERFLSNSHISCESWFGYDFTIIEDKPRNHSLGYTFTIDTFKTPATYFNYCHSNGKTHREYMLMDTDLIKFAKENNL